MRVTCELWAYIEQYGGKLMSGRQAEELAAIAEHIDQAHESVIYDMRREHDEWVADRDANYVKLPVDADGVPIHVGDVMETEDNRILNVETMQVSSRKWSIGLVTTLDSAFSWHDADRLRHHHKPTVEDVLREMLYKAHIYDEREMELLPDLIAEYAAKLRLAESEES